MLKKNWIVTLTTAIQVIIDKKYSSDCIHNFLPQKLLEVFGSDEIEGNFFNNKNNKMHFVPEQNEFRY